MVRLRRPRKTRRTSSLAPRTSDRLRAWSRPAWLARFFRHLVGPGRDRFRLTRLQPAHMIDNLLIIGVAGLDHQHRLERAVHSRSANPDEDGAVFQHGRDADR